jgi:SAM-dependent methyltransferase
MSPLSPRLAEIVNALPLRPGMRVLEIGCGPGAAARAIAARLGTGHILAIDRSAKAIAQARLHAAAEIASGRMSLRQVSAEDLVLAPGEQPLILPSQSASAPSMVAIPRRVGRRWPASPRCYDPEVGCSSTVATRCARCYCLAG